ncbi:MAG: hypothetical protein JSW20_13535 [Nitrospiraceae bacterium]|nr:MAG: hypothetical protein JSW20_13535 [Nitrospiraceae bacterium]
MEVEPPHFFRPFRHGETMVVEGIAGKPEHDQYWTDLFSFVYKDIGETERISWVY